MNALVSLSCIQILHSGQAGQYACKNKLLETNNSMQQSTFEFPNFFFFVTLKMRPDRPLE